MAKTAADLALAMKVIAGPDPLDPSTSPVPVPTYTEGLSGTLKGVRIGVPEAYYFDRVDPEIRLAVQGAIQVCKDLGAAIKKMSLHLQPQASIAAFLILMAEGAASLEKWHRTRAMELGEDVRSRLNLGAAVLATHYLKAQRVRRLVQEEFSRAFRQADVILTPQLPITAPRIGQGVVTWGKKTEPVPSALTRFTRIFNLVGIPALSVPCGFSSAGLPLGLQIAGRPFDEATVLKVGHAYEANTPWKDRHPSFDERSRGHS